MIPDVAAIATAVFSTVSSNPVLASSGYKKFELGGLINDNAMRTPWVGVWAGDMELTPKNIVAGIPQTWYGTAEVLIYHQCSTRRGSAMRELKEAQSLVITAVTSDLPMRGTTLTLERISGQLEQFNPDGEEQFLTNLIKLTYRVQGGP